MSRAIRRIFGLPVLHNQFLADLQPITLSRPLKKDEDLFPR